MTAKLIALVLPLGLDTFTVASALGLGGLPRHRRLRVSLLMAAFEAGMPLIGLAVGAPLGRAIGSGADYAAAGILVALGAYGLIWREDDEDGLARRAQDGGWSALVIGLAVSLDELAIGFTLGLLRVPVVLVVGLIAAQAFVLSQAGLWLGARLAGWAREAGERLAALALLGLGVYLVVQRLV